MAHWLPQCATGVGTLSPSNADQGIQASTEVSGAAGGSSKYPKKNVCSLYPAVIVEMKNSDFTAEN